MKFMFHLITMLAIAIGMVSQLKGEGAPSESHSEMACQFETSTRAKGAEQPDGKYTWRLWRSKHEVEVYQVGSKDGEAWILDGAGGVMHSRILHPERAEVVFNAMELRILGRPVDWGSCCSLISPEFVQRALEKKGLQMFLGNEVLEYKGEVRGQQWTVLWDAKDQLAVSIEVEHDGRISKTVLRERYPLSEQPWERLRSRGYEQIAYTELGDNDTDPHIKRIMSRMGIKCSHKGCSTVCLTPGPSIR